MRTLARDMVSGIRIGFRDRNNFVTFIALWVILFVFMFSIPVINIPGNSILFQAQLFRGDEYAILILLSLFSAFSLVLQWVAFRISKKGAGQEAFLGGTGVLSGVISSLFASASCATCIGALFSFLGFNTILFLAIHRWYILVFALLLLFLSIILATRKIVRGCEVCVVG